MEDVKNSSVTSTIYSVVGAAATTILYLKILGTSTVTTSTIISTV